MKRRQRKSKPRRKYQRTQRGDVLNSYDFVYAGRDKVNQVEKISPGIIKNATKEINDVAEQGITKWRQCFPKFLEEPMQTSIRHLSDCWDILGKSS